MPWLCPDVSEHGTQSHRWTRTTHRGSRGQRRVRWQRGMGQIRLDAYGDGGYGGLRAGSDLAGRITLWRNRLGFEGRLLYMYFADDVQTENHSHMMGVQLGARWAIINGLCSTSSPRTTSIGFTTLSFD